jgi:hypothetical protein
MGVVCQQHRLSYIRTICSRIFIILTTRSNNAFSINCVSERARAAYR